MNVFSYDNDHL
jgi:F0F1-type ATP synthase gamma subunit